MNYGKIAWEGYRAHTHGISLVTRMPISQWDELAAEIRSAWEAAGSAVAAVAAHEVLERAERKEIAPVLPDTDSDEDDEDGDDETPY